MSLAAPTAMSVDGAALKLGIVAARFNEALVDALVAQVQAHFEAAGVKAQNVTLIRVPGSGELPSAAQMLCADATSFDAVVALGVIVRGDTIHYHLLAEAAQQGLQRVSLDTRTPIIAGLVVAETQAQAEARCRGAIDRGAEFARAALEMAALKKTLSQ